MISSSITANAGIAIGGCGPTDRSNPTHASTTMQGGKAVFENDNYKITASDANLVEITNKKTGEHYKVWGDPHVDVDGKHAFDFWGTTTFQLNDGTKLTFETVPAGNGMTLPSKLTISNGDYGAQISGIDTVKQGDLRVEEGKGWGQLTDNLTDDGNVLYENANGKGFVAIDDSGQIRQVDQAHINATDLQKGGAQNQQNQQMADLFRSAFQFMSGLMSIVMSGQLLRNMGGDDHGPRRGGSTDGGRAFPGGTPWFDESAGGRRPQHGHHHHHHHHHHNQLNIDISLNINVHLHRWQG